MVEKSLRDVGGDKVLKHLPLGLDEPVIEKGGTLSSGQRQLISFARALAFNPAILILDEATASIDTETEAIIQKGMEVLKKGERPSSLHIDSPRLKMQIKFWYWIKVGLLSKVHMKN